MGLDCTTYDQVQDLGDALKARIQQAMPNLRLSGRVEMETVWYEGRRLPGYRLVYAIKEKTGIFSRRLLVEARDDKHADGGRGVVIYDKSLGKVVGEVLTETGWPIISD